MPKQKPKRKSWPTSLGNYSEQVEPGSESEDDESENENPDDHVNLPESTMLADMLKDPEDELLDAPDGESDADIIGTGFGGQNAALPKVIRNRSTQEANPKTTNPKT